MKKLLILSLLILTIFGIAGCSSINPGNATVFSNDGNVSVSVPSGWNTSDTAITKVFPGAVIAASNPANHEYLAVIGERKSSLGANSNIDTFFAQIKAASVASIANTVWGTPSAVTVDGLSGLTVQATGVYRQSKADSTFFLNVLANNNYYYAVIAFTDTASSSTNGATLQKVINSFKAPRTTVIRGNWKPYVFPWTIILAFILLVLAIGFMFLGTRLKRKTFALHPGKALRVAILVVWSLLILFILGITVVSRAGKAATTTASTSGIGPIFPITILCAVLIFAYLVYICRHEGFWGAVGNGFLGFAAGPMVFEFPFDMIVISQIKASPIYLLAYFGVLDLTVLLTLSLLMLSKRVRITRYSLYSFGAMLLVFAVWAWFGFSYPSSPLPFALNAISKILGFVTIFFLFSTKSERSSQGGTAKST